MALQRIGAAATSTSGNVALAVPGAVRTGDLLVALFAEWGAYPTALSTPKGWARLANEGASPRGGVAYAKVAEAADAGVTVTWANPSGARVGAVLVAYRGAETPNPIAADADAFRFLLSTGAVTSHQMPATSGYQADDVRLLLWSVNGVPTTFTAPAATGYTTLSNQAQVLAGELVTLVPGSAGNLTATTSAATSSIMVAATLHARPVARPSGLLVDHSGHVGLME